MQFCVGVRFCVCVFVGLLFFVLVVFPRWMVQPRRCSRNCSCSRRNRDCGTTSTTDPIPYPIRTHHDSHRRHRETKNVVLPLAVRCCYYDDHVLVVGMDVAGCWAYSLVLLHCVDPDNPTIPIDAVRLARLPMPSRRWTRRMFQHRRIDRGIVVNCVEE